MGLAKDRIMKGLRGWSLLGDKSACHNCIEDDALKSFVKATADQDHCDYCGRSAKKPIAVAVDDLVNHINDSLLSEYADPDDEGVIYESREGGYQGVEVFDTWDLLDEIIGNPLANDDLLRDVATAFNHYWCQKHFAQLKPEEALKYGWEEFTRTVNHSRRYLFSIAPDEHAEGRGFEEIPPAQFLGRLEEVINQVDLVRLLPAGTRIVRGRAHHPHERFTAAAELGTPTVRAACYSNRMSPAGIPMFYGAFDENTVRAELYDSLRSKQIITVGTFLTARAFRVLDLTNLPGIPSLFDTENRHKRPGLKFLCHFVQDLSGPISKDGREHIDYVPTQVVTEYFRKVFRDDQGEPVKGITYNSSRRGMGKCCVLFFEHDECCDISPGWDRTIKSTTGRDKIKWLGLDQSTVKRVKPLKA